MTREVVFTYFICADGCSGQYRCRQNFLSGAKICCEKIGNKIQIVYSIASRFSFKGEWDGEGGVSKAMLKSEELKGNRSPTPVIAYKTLSDLASITRCRYPVDQWIGDKDRQIVRKAPSVLDSRQYQFVTCKHDEYQQFIGADDRYTEQVLYLNREVTITDHSNPPKALDGTNSNYHFCTGTKAISLGNDSSPPSYEIMMGRNICGCPECRKGEFGACINQEAIGQAVSRITGSRVNY